MFISFVWKLNKRFPHKKHEKEENINNQERFENLPFFKRTHCIMVLRNKFSFEIKSRVCIVCKTQYDAVNNIYTCEYKRILRISRLQVTEIHHFSVPLRSGYIKNTDNKYTFFDTYHN